MQQQVGSTHFLSQLTPVATQPWRLNPAVTQAFGVIFLRRDNIPPAANFPVLTEAPFQGLAPQFPSPVLTEAPFQGLALHFPPPVLTEPISKD